jgi:siderophore synthetase component
MTMASLLHVDRAGRSLAAARVGESGLAPEVWLRRYLDAYLVPQLYCLYEYDLAFFTRKTWPSCRTGNIVLVVSHAWSSV